jgi:hypothetical protein
MGQLSIPRMTGRENCWNDNLQEKCDVLGKSLSTAILLPTDLTQTALGSNPSVCSEVVATNCLSYSITLIEHAKFLPLCPISVACNAHSYLSLVTCVRAMMNVLIFTGFHNLLSNY